MRHYNELQLDEIKDFAEWLTLRYPAIKKITLHRGIERPNKYVLEVSLGGDSEQQACARNELTSLIPFQDRLAEFYEETPTYDPYLDWAIHVTDKFSVCDLYELRRGSEMVLFNASVPDPRAFVEGLVLEVTADGEINFRPRRANGRAFGAQALGFRDEGRKSWKLLRAIIEDKKDSIELTTPATRKMLRRVENKLKVAISRNFGVDVSGTKLFEKVPGRKGTYRSVFSTEQVESRTRDEGEHELDKILDDYKSGEISVYEAREQIGTLLSQEVITKEQAELAAESLKWAKTNNQF